MVSSEDFEHLKHRIQKKDVAKLIKKCREYRSYIKIVNSMKAGKTEARQKTLQTIIDNTKEKLRKLNGSRNL